MRGINLLLGSVLAVLFSVKLLRGERFAYLTQGLEGKEYPLRGLYAVGYSWSETPLLSFRGKARERLTGQARVLYGSKYAEYYANLAWVQMLTFVHLSLMLGLILAGVLNMGMLAVFGLLGAGLFGFYFFNRMNDQLKLREAECMAQLPEIVSTMALLIHAGMVLRSAWRLIAESGDGTIYRLMRQACTDMDNGMSEIDAIYQFGRNSGSAEVRKFTGALTQSLERGGGELSSFLARQSVEIWALKKQIMLQKGEVAATKLLIPTSLLFVGIIIAVLSGAAGMLLL